MIIVRIIMILNTAYVSTRQTLNPTVSIRRFITSMLWPVRLCRYAASWLGAPTTITCSVYITCTAAHDRLFIVLTASLTADLFRNICIAAVNSLRTPLEVSELQGACNYGGPCDPYSAPRPVRNEPQSQSRIIFAVII